MNTNTTVTVTKYRAAVLVGLTDEMERMKRLHTGLAAQFAAAEREVREKMSAPRPNVIQMLVSRAA